jgi:hypothetical protein
VGPAFIVLGLIVLNRTEQLVGETVRLQIDDEGVRGWPLAEDLDTSWDRVRRARRLGGVIALPFRNFGTRAGWIPIPERALTPEQLSDLRVLLAKKGLMKRPAASPTAR